MEDTSRLLAHIEDRYNTALRNSYLTATAFLSYSEQAAFFKYLRKQKINPSFNHYKELDFVLYGGYEEAERKMLFFLPYYMKREDFFNNEKSEESIISSLHIYPRNLKFADNLTHRDFLGALMHLGLDRSLIGDILTEGKDGYIMMERKNIPLFTRDLVKVKHTVMDTDEVSSLLCPYKPKLKDVRVIVSSPRLDAVIAEVFNLSRKEAQISINKEEVFVEGETVLSNSYQLKTEERVSVMHHGKFIYKGEKNLTKKGRHVLAVALFC